MQHPEKLNAPNVDANEKRKAAAQDITDELPGETNLVLWPPIRAG